MKEKQSIVDFNGIKEYGSKLAADVAKEFFDTRDKNVDIIKNSDMSSSDKVAAMHRNDAALVAKILVGGIILGALWVVQKYL